jgi:NDP-sugar pyrophosphorylase family protein
MPEPLPKLAVLAGGLASRLRPITETIPKCLVEVAGEPFLGHQLRRFRAQGWQRVVLLTGHLGEQIESFVASRDWGLDIAFARDGASPLGTGGALRHALPLLGEEFGVTYGDSWLEEDPVLAWQAFRLSGLPALMAVVHNRDRWDASNVSFDGARVTRHDKSARGQAGIEWVDWGLSFFKAEALHDVPTSQVFDLAALTGRLAREGRLAGFAMATPFLEIGQPEGLAATDAHLRRRRP